MLEILKKSEDSTLTVSVIGKLDTVTAPTLEAELQSCIDGVKKLVLNFEKLEYISSAGLRVLLSAQKKMNLSGEMKIINVCSAVMDVFDITGFTEILTIE